MGVDEEYLEELLNSIDRIVDPEAFEATGEEYSGSSIEEELDSAVAEPMELEGMEPGIDNVVAADYSDSSVMDDAMPVQPAEEIPVAAAEEYSADPVSSDIPAGLEAFDINPEDGNKILSPDEIAAMFSAVSATSDPGSDESSELEESQSDNILDNLLMDGGDVEEVDLGDVDVSDAMSMSVEEIDAMLDAAKAGSSDIDLMPSSDEDLMALLAGSGDEDLSDIQSLLDSDENGEAVDEEAFAQAMSVEDVADGILEEEDGKKKKKEKKAKKQKKSKKKKGEEETDELDELASIPDKDAKNKKGFFARLLDLLTEPVGDEESEIEAISIDENGAISDENRDILAELDKEKGKKKSKKAKKSKKGKKGEEAAGGDNPDDIREKGDDEEVVVEKKKKKKEKKPKTKKVKEKEPEAPQKRLSKKRVRVTIILCLSLLACILVGTFGFTRVLNLSDARWAFDNQDYETTYENLYGLKLGESDSKIYNTSKTLLLIDRKYKSYENYMRLGMRVEAVAALFDAVRDYPDLREKAITYGVEAEVDYTYSQVIAALSGFGISEQEAKEIVAYDSKVRYTLRLQSIANGTPYTYDDEIAASTMPPQSEETVEEEAAVRTVDDILPEEGDFLPDDPNSIFDMNE